MKKRPRLSRLNSDPQGTFRINSNNPNIARYLGRSHPNAPRVFVVAEIGESTAGEYFELPHGTTVKLRSYLQMYIDWQDLTFYSRTMGLHIPPDEQFHTHSSECLSSLSFKQDGRFTVLAEDLQHTNVFCLQHHLITMLDKNFAGTSKARNEWNVELAAGSLSMMRVLEYEARPGFTDLDIDDLYKHRLPNIHSYHWVVQSTRVEVGDYAYKDYQQGHFVRLGNVSEILPCKRSVGWEDCMSIDGVLQTAAYNGASAECVWRVVLERNKCVQISFYGRLHDTDLQPFWWLYCRSAADYHGVALQQLVVVNTIAHSCNILIDVDLWDEGRDTLYFHRLPIMSNDEVPSPFGYWSFDREPSPGPWPDISIPGMKMQYRYEYRYTYLSALQAQLATCFSDCLWASCPPLPFPQRSAIDNTESFRSSGSHSPNTWSTHRGHDNDDDHSYCSDSASIVDDECYETADEYVDND